MKANIDDSSFGPQADPCGEWFERAVHGDEAAASRLYRHCVPRLQGWLAARMPDSHAADLAHDALSLAFRKHHLFRPGTFFMSWLRTLAWRAAINQSRNHSREKKRVLTWVQQEQTAGSDDPILDELRLGALDRCLCSLPTSQRRLVDLHYNQGRTSQSIADELGQSRSAVAVGLMRIRHKLRTNLICIQHET
jgi:RNA polymerase sigma factor (sigma-70 family)